MKLFLRLQVEERALEIWETEENLEKEHEKRLEKRDQAKAKKFNKKLNNKGRGVVLLVWGSSLGVT